MYSTFENFLSKSFYSKCQQHININTNALYVTNKGMVSLIIFAINIHFETLFITQCDWEGGGLMIRHLKTSFAGNSWPSAVDIPEKPSRTMTSDNDFRSGVQVLFLIILLRVFAN